MVRACGGEAGGAALGEHAWVEHLGGQHGVGAGGVEDRSERARIHHESMAKLESLLPNTESFALSGATHFLQMEKPAEAAHALGSFLRRHPIGH